ncbi:hypothetical protein GCM10028858_16510 [Halorubrum pallidum]
MTSDLTASQPATGMGTFVARPIAPERSIQMTSVVTSRHSIRPNKKLPVAGSAEDPHARVVG